MKYKRYLLFSYMVGLISLTAQSMHIQSSEIKPLIKTVLLPDTTEYGEDTDLKANDTINKTKGNLAKGTLNALDYRMDTRYFSLGDSLGKQKWYRDIFLQLGMGVENIMAPTESYKFNTLNTFHLAVGKQFGKYHSLRLQADVVLGYQQYYGRMYQRLGGQFDYLFNISSYLNGYNPSRIFELGTIIGLGRYRARLRGTGRLAYPYEAHGGLQFRFYTGPHGVFNIEPYISLATDNIDLSQNRNWRRHDPTFGVNANYVYYFDNHLTRAARNRILTESKEKNPNRVTADSTRLYSWQTPWQFDVAAGVSFMDLPQKNLKETMGYELAFSVGKWFSPVIGLRATAMGTKQPTYRIYAGTRLEGMFNPLGFLHSFRWDAPVGFYFVGGAGIGRLVKRPDLHCWSEYYSAGIHLWARLTDGLQFFVEPRYVYRSYNVPYRNVGWQANFSEQSYGVNAGITVANIPHTYRRYETAKGEQRPRMSAGLGGGIHMLSSNSSYKGKRLNPYNINAFFEYRMSNVSGARLALGFVKHNTFKFAQYYDLNMNLPESGYAPVLRRGLWNYTNYLGIITLDYELNLINVFCGYRTGRLFDLEAFAGPSLVWTMNGSAVLDKPKTLHVGHEARLLFETPGKAYAAVNGGMKLTANVYRGFGITLTPQLYYVRNLEIRGLSMGRLKVLGTFDMGLQYQF